MTQIFEPQGKLRGVTLIEAGPCRITQIRTATRDGYDAVQLGYGNRRHLSKPVKGHLAKKNIEENYRYLREFPVVKIEGKEGDEVSVTNFAPGDAVAIVGTSKGKGFQGVVKRHHFAGGYKSHGHRHEERSRGSIGQRFPQHTLKGTRMPGRMGGERVTQKGLRIISIIPEKNLLAVSGTVPGTRGSLVAIMGI